MMWKDSENLRSIGSTVFETIEEVHNWQFRGHLWATFCRSLIADVRL